MNLHGIVAPAIGAVNPFVSGTIRQSTGYTVQPNGNRAPLYTDIPARIQVQALTANDLAHLDGLNVQGTKRAIYLTGEAAGVIRDQNRGGDLVVFPAGTLPEGDTWLVTLVLEQWPDWVRAAITLQNEV